MAKFTTMLLYGEARSWFNIRRYVMNALTWAVLHDNMLAYFLPIDYDRKERDILAATRKNSPYIDDYIHRFHLALVNYDTVPDDEAPHQLTTGLWVEVKMHVLVQRPATFNEAAMIAERIGIVVQLSWRGKGGKKWKGKAKYPMHLP